MNREQVKQFRTWFHKYVADFYGSDEFINANIKLKEDHSIRTCGEMNYITRHLGLSENQKNIAEVIALFHDIGRFTQFSKYRTYTDHRSINHCLLGVEVLKQTRILESIDSIERNYIEKAVEYHGIKELPASLEGDSLLFAKLIRDADKMDIYYVVINYCQQYRRDPKNFKLEIEFPDTPDCSQDIINDILAAKRIDYKKVRTLNDFRIMQLGWVYDVNFTPALIRIKERKFLETILDFLPKTEDIDKVKKKIFEYVDERIAKQGQ